MTLIEAPKASMALDMSLFPIVQGSENIPGSIYFSGRFFFMSEGTFLLTITFSWLLLLLLLVRNSLRNFTYLGMLFDGRQER